MHYKEAFNRRMMELREANQMNQLDFASLMIAEAFSIQESVSESYAPIEFRIEMIIATANMFGCSVDYLLGRTDEPSVNAPK